MRSGFAEAIEINEAKPNVTVEEIAVATPLSPEYGETGHSSPSD